MPERWREKADFAAQMLRNAALDYQGDLDRPSPDQARALLALAEDVRHLATMPGQLVLEDA